MTIYRMYKDSERELRFPLAVSVSYQNGDRGKHSKVVRGYATCDLGDRTPAQIEHRYRKRSAIESSYRLFQSARAVTLTQDPIVRFAFVVVGFLLENL
ncbi:transposase IS4 family protein [Halococcus salifodinae DSM 8989]|uniref:Transposase IS4 family protein n=1 Tax=Halococcus salifodinae DSM 8989 TaxID=1227456 RepID=M0MSF5_9EURY|nr:transposase IS4 family protein [Halococcus salifodinae DSM 8989]